MSELSLHGSTLRRMLSSYGADASGSAVSRKKLRQDQELTFFSQLELCIETMWAFGGSHY